jgi:hypothetical protein
MLSGSQATRVGEEDAGRSHKGYVLAGRRAPRAGSIEQKGGQERGDAQKDTKVKRGYGEKRERVVGWAFGKSWSIRKLGVGRESL